MRGRAPYSVARYPEFGGTVAFVGFDGAGEALLEVRVPVEHADEELVSRIRAWVREHDGGPPAGRPRLTLVD